MNDHINKGEIEARPSSTTPTASSTRCAKPTATCTPCRRRSCAGCTVWSWAACASPMPGLIPEDEPIVAEAQAMIEAAIANCKIKQRPLSISSQRGGGRFFCSHLGGNQHDLRYSEAPEPLSGAPPQSWTPPLTTCRPTTLPPCRWPHRGGRRQRVHQHDGRHLAPGRRLPPGVPQTVCRSSDRHYRQRGLGLHRFPAKRSASLPATAVFRTVPAS